MDIFVLLVAILISGLADFLAAALLNIPSSVVSTMADEGSQIGKRLKHAIDDANETRLAISIVDVLVLVIASFIVVSITINDGGKLAFDATIFIIGVVLIKIVASALGERTAEFMLRFTSISLILVTGIVAPFVLAHRALLALTQPRSREEEEEEAREELEALVETAREEGALDAGEYRIMTNIMQLSSIEVSDVMTPRTVIAAIGADNTVADAIKLPELQTFSRLPVFDGHDLDTVSGYVMTKDILRAALAGRHTVLVSKLRRDIGYIPENVTLERALEQFLQKRQHLFMVVDEHGGVEGLLTMEDVLETMLGVEIIDEADHVVDLRALAKQRRDARIAILSQP
ncbi:MAG: CNNM domain-containing protein [Candidatus Kapabacteria bacterium]|nr:CNNM domain-containing protein [Candidatus Kapabacteria bacterium]